MGLKKNGDDVVDLVNLTLNVEFSVSESSIYTCVLFTTISKAHFGPRLTPSNISVLVCLVICVALFVCVSPCVAF